MLTPLRNWHNKHIREMCRVTIHQVELYGITSVELQKRIAIWDLDYYVKRRTLQWVGHVVRMDKSRLPRRLLKAWVREPRPEFGQEMTVAGAVAQTLRSTTPIHRVGHTSPGPGRMGAPHHPQTPALTPSLYHHNMKG